MNQSYSLFYFRSALATIICHPAGYVRIDWEVLPMTSAEVRALFRRVLVVLKQEQLRKVLTDCPAAPPLRAEDCQWLEREWLPQAVPEAGVTYCAIVEGNGAPASPVPYVPLALRNAMPLVIRGFSSFAAAEAWPREV